MFELFL